MKTLPPVLAVLGAGVMACSTTETRYIDEPLPETTDAGTATDSGMSPDSGLGILSFRPPASFSGFDGTHSFKVPVAVYSAADDLVVSASNGAGVVPKRLVEPARGGVTDNGRYFLVTVKQAGPITLTATTGGRTATSTITVTSYPAGRWARGETRYTKGESGDPPCTDCHVNGQGVDHSPASLSTATDEKVGITITTGISPYNVPILIDGQPSHSWKVSDAERDGLVTYLRGLEPRGFE